jgi:hypothetical protein
MLKQARTSFLKKRRPAWGSKKLLFRFARRWPTTGQRRAQRTKSFFFASSFSKKEVLAFFLMASPP